jgi:hypothetical protein
MVNDTACENCPFKEMGFKTCPNYIETFWQEQGNPQPKIVKDCSPKRTLLMLQELYNRFFGLQQQVSQAEGAIVDFRALLSSFAGELEKVLERDQFMKLPYHPVPCYQPPYPAPSPMCLNDQQI